MEFVHEGIEFTHVSRMILLFTYQKKNCLPEAKKVQYFARHTYQKPLLTLCEFFSGFNCQPCSFLEENKVKNKIRAFGKTCLLFSGFEVCSLILTFQIIAEIFSKELVLVIVQLSQSGTALSSYFGYDVAVLKRNCSVFGYMKNLNAHQS